MIMNKETNKCKKNNGFGLLSVIIIMIITAIISGLATGIIVTNNYNNVSVLNYNLNDDKDFQGFVDLYSTILEKYYDEIDKKEMINAAKEGMLNFLGDKYTTILSDEDYNNIVEGLQDEYKGIGVTIQNNIIVAVTEDSPAEQAGLQVNDAIIMVNNKNVEKYNSSQISSMIKKNKIDTVSLVIKRNEELMNFTIKKSNLSYPYVESKIIDNTTIGYMSISAFSEKLSKQIENSLDELKQKGMTSLIIDLRNNGGGYLSAANESASLFLNKGLTIYSLKSTDGTTIVKDETDKHEEIPIIVIVNGQTASASEILAAALKQSYGATLVGTKTYGKGKVQQISSLKTGENVKYTTAEWLTPSGICIDGAGLNVDYVVELQYSYNENDEIIGVVDTQLDKAIELLK